MHWVPLVLAVIIGFEPRTSGIAGCAIRGVILTVNWGGGPNGFVTKGFYGGMKPLVNKSSSKLESSDVQIDLVLDLGD